MEEIASCPADQATCKYSTTHTCSCFLILTLVVTAVLSLTGCAAIKGSPDPVIDTNTALTDLKLYLAGDVVTKFYSGNDADRNGMSARDWRDGVISAHIAAANLRFRDYTQQLYSQTVRFNIGRAWAVLGLSGAAAVASQGAANALAAASAGLGSF